MSDPYGAPMSMAAIRRIEADRIREAQANARAAFNAMHQPAPGPDPRIARREELDQIRQAVILRHPDLDSAAVDKAASRILAVDTQRQVDASFEAMQVESDAEDARRSAETDAMLARVRDNAESDAALREAVRAEADAEFGRGVRGRQIIDARNAVNQGDG